FWVAVRDGGERAIEQSGQRLHRLAVAAAADQDERKIITQRREIAIAGEHSGLQIALGERTERAARDSSGEVKCDERLKFCLHVRFALTVFAKSHPRPHALGRTLASAACGQIVNLSNSASRPALI